MPTYDYVCESCGHEFEHFQSMTDKRLLTCPMCAKKKLVRKVGSGGGVIFKGSGFYETDYKRPASKAADAAASKASDASNSKSADAKPAEPSAKSDAKSGSKSETKAESKTESASKTKDAPATKTPAPSSGKSASSGRAPRGTCASGDGSSK
jgi:putative FmdB family regulatory protein